MGKRRLRAVGILLMVCVSSVWLAPGAMAACHAFTMEVSPTTVEPGDTVTVTVSRDAARDDSSVRVTASAGTARAGTDFSELNEQVEFTGSSTEESLEIDIPSGAGEGTFTVGLSEPDGCAINPNFRLASDQTVTIAADEIAEEPVEEASPPAVITDRDETADDEGFPVLLLVFLVLVILGTGYVLYTRRSRP